MYLWSSLVKKPTTVDIKKTKHLQIITDPTNTSRSEAIYLAPCRDKIHLKKFQTFLMYKIIKLKDVSL